MDQTPEADIVKAYRKRKPSGQGLSRRIACFLLKFNCFKSQRNPKINNYISKEKTNAQTESKVPECEDSERQSEDLPTLMTEEMWRREEHRRRVQGYREQLYDVTGISYPKSTPYY